MYTKTHLYNFIHILILYIYIHTIFYTCRVASNNNNIAAILLIPGEPHTKIYQQNHLMVPRCSTRKVSGQLISRISGCHILKPLISIASTVQLAWIRVKVTITRISTRSISKGQAAR